MIDIEQCAVEKGLTHTDYVALCPIRIQMQFLRKVYGIVAVQLFFVACMSFLIISLDDVKFFLQKNPGFFLLLFFATLLSLFAIYLNRFECPTNFAWLALFTFFESLTIGTIVSVFDKVLIIRAISLTGVVITGLAIYTLQTKTDFSMKSANLYVILCLLLTELFIQLFIPSSLIEFVITIGSALIFSLYLVYDTKQILRKTSPEEYIDASIQIYLDITCLFIEVLRLTPILYSD